MPNFISDLSSDKLLYLSRSQFPISKMKVIIPALQCQKVIWRIE